jgi:hypothetical protein
LPLLLLPSRAAAIACGRLPPPTAVSVTGVPGGATDSDRYRQAVRRAVALLPRHPVQVSVIDVNDAKPQDRDYLWRLQAFVIHGQPVVYLTKHGEVLRAALHGTSLHDHMLATVIWHEMAHVDGADEAESRSREEGLWARFMLENAVDRDAALKYLVALKHRPPPGDQQPSLEAAAVHARADRSVGNRHQRREAEGP